MNWPWLPDAQQYRHPLLSWLIQCGFSLTAAALYRIHYVQLPVVLPRRGVLIVSNHQRDSDVPILAAALCRRRGPRILDPLPYFAIREDMYRRGGLGTLLWRWPWPLPALLGAIPLAWMFRTVRTVPIHRVPEYSLGEALQALCAAGLGRAPPQQVLNARGARELAAIPGAARRSRLDQLGPRQLGRLRGVRGGLRRLQRPARQRLVPILRATIDGQLRELAGLRDQGHAVYFAPEGRVSPDGRMGRVRAGTWRLCQLSRQTAVLPCGLAYDALAPGRLRAVVTAGLPQSIDPSDSRRFASELRAAIAPLCAVTPSHLLAHYLLHGPRAFGTDTLCRWMGDAVAAAARRRVLLDPLLQGDLAGLCRRRLRWLQRQGLVRRAEGLWHRQLRAEAAPGWRQPADVVAYLARVLSDLQPELAQELIP